MSVHYKFKAALEYSTVTFDGIHITVADLKKEIIEQKHLKQTADFDLQIMNAQTEEVYEDENTLIPKNTSVIVARIPVTNKRSSGGGGAPFHHRQQHNARPPPPSLQPSQLAKGVDLASMDATEEEKIREMMKQSTDLYDPKHYQRLRGAGQHGRVPPHYRCNKCSGAGHWIKDCPLQTEHSDIKKSTGIPRSFMVHVEGPDVPGALLTPEGGFAVPVVDHAAYMEKNKPAVKPPPPKPKIPDELVCTLCNDLMTDALMVPCCANSYCDDCIRKALVESDEHECPGCHEKEISPTSLIPNRFLRSTVNTFKNETGYSKPQPAVEAKKEPPVIMVDLTDKKAEESERRKLSLDELPDDLFPHSPRKIDPESEAKEKETSGNEDEEKTDLYDFNDGSIPSPFASPPRTAETQENEQAIRTIGTVNNYYSGQPPGHMARHHQQQQQQQPPHMHPPHHHQPPHHGRPPKEGYRQSRPPPHQGGMPPGPPMHHGHHPPPSVRRPPGAGPGGPHPGSGPPQMPPSDSHEPPPPGFGDMLPLPPGEDRVPTPTGRGREEGMHRREDPNMRREMGDRDRDGHRDGGNGEGPPRGSLLPLPGIPPFNPNQPPPGFSNPGGMPPGPPSQSQKGPMGLPPPGPGPVYSGPPQGSGPPPPMGMIPPNQNYPPPYHGGYGMPPGGGGGGGGRPPMYGHPGGPGMRGPHPRDRDRDGRYLREKSMRKPLPRDGRLRERDRPEEIKPGFIDDPLKEFERIMREKDRRKKIQQDRKRSRSRSYSPGGRRTPPSPFPKRSRSRSYSRSPSPKRKRPGPLRRRDSYSRTPSRSPPPVRRRLRSRSRNRSLSPPSALSKRRSPRRAPPFSPSPPPSRFPPLRKEKDDFYDRPPRYDAGPPSRSYYNTSSASGPNNSKPYNQAGRDYGEPVPKYDSIKYSDAPKYDQGSHLPGPPVGSKGFDKFEPRRSRDREMYLHHSGSSGPPPPSSFRDRDRDRDRGRDIRDRDREPDHRDRDANRQLTPYDYDPSLMPPGTESHIQSNNLTVVPSLFELEISPPASYPQKGPIQLGAPPPQSQKESHRKSRENEPPTELGSLSVTPDSDDGSHKDRDGKKRHRKKSREGSSDKGEKKKEKKEKKKHKRKKEKEEKKLKKSKKSKSDKVSRDGSEDEQTTTTADETGPSRRNSMTETPGAGTKEEAGRVFTEGEKPELKPLGGETERRPHEIDSKNTSLTVIVCDSTVKSPERTSQSNQAFKTGKELDYNGVKVGDSGSSVKKHVDGREIEQTVLHETDHPSKLIETARQSASETSIDDGFGDKDKGDSRLMDSSLTDKEESVSESTKLEEVPVVSSKWDQFGEDEDGEALMQTGDLAQSEASKSGEDGGQTASLKSAVEKKVTSEVLKRAENAIFAKAISAISVGSSRSSSAARRSPPPHSSSSSSSSSKRKVYIENFEVPDTDKDSKSKPVDADSMKYSGTTAVVGHVEVETKGSSVPTTTVKRSVRERLGSKVSDDTVAGATSSRSRDRSSPSRDRDKDKQIKSQVSSAPSRDREKDKRKSTRSRSRSPRTRRDRSRSPRSGRERERERDRDRHRRDSGRRSSSRSRRRSTSRSKRDRPRSSPRSSSRTRQYNRQLNRQRTPLKLGRRSRSISSSRGKRPRSGSGSRAKDTSSQRRARTDKDSRDQKEHEEKEPSPPGDSSRSHTSPQRTSKMNKTEEEAAWKQQANKFVPIGGGAQAGQDKSAAKNEDSAGSAEGAVWKQSGSSGTNPVPLAVRKQRGRINIKLSSTTTSKNEAGKSSSSSSDEEEHQDKGGEGGKDNKSSAESDDSRKEEKKRKKERKKAKRRRSESSSSSSSDDSAPRKSKKSKKKKKKSKKKKKLKS